MVGDTILKMDYQKKVVVSALRVFLEPNHLYDLLFEDVSLKKNQGNHKNAPRELHGDLCARTRKNSAAGGYGAPAPVESRQLPALNNFYLQ